MFFAGCLAAGLHCHCPLAQIVAQGFCVRIRIAVSADRANIGGKAPGGAGGSGNPGSEGMVADRNLFIPGFAAATAEEAAQAGLCFRGFPDHSALIPVVAQGRNLTGFFVTAALTDTFGVLFAGCLAAGHHCHCPLAQIVAQGRNRVRRIAITAKAADILRSAFLRTGGQNHRNDKLMIRHRNLFIPDFAAAFTGVAAQAGSIVGGFQDNNAIIPDVALGPVRSIRRCTAAGSLAYTDIIAAHADHLRIVRYGPVMAQGIRVYHIHVAAAGS